MTLCAEYKIPHSVFLSWDAEDRAKAIAFMYAKSEECVMCGTSSYEWNEDRFAYVAEIHHCRGCEIKKALQENATGDGMTVELVKNTEERKWKEQERLRKQFEAKREELKQVKAERLEAKRKRNERNGRAVN